MNILFVIDKIELKYFEFNNLVTNFWLIKEFLKQKHSVYITTIDKLNLSNQVAFSNCYSTYLKNENIFYQDILLKKEINSFDLVMFRPDPPVDIDYINATYVFDFVNTTVINLPSSIRNFNEKLHTLYFQNYMPNSLVSASFNDIKDFLYKYKKIVLKPMNKCFGSGVMVLEEGDLNTRTIINTLTENEKTMIMVQEFVSDVSDGDVRLLTLGNEVLPYGIKKIPTADDFKFNTHNDKFLVKTEVDLDTIKYFRPVAEKLNSIGIKMAGLDVINNKIIEINVTSPCYFIKEINQIYNIRLEEIIMKSILTSSLLTL